MSSSFDVVIVGSGITGASLAVILATRGITAPERIAMVADRAPPPPDPAQDIDLRVYALNRASQRLLERIGVWAALPADRVCAYERMCVWDAASAPG